MAKPILKFVSVAERALAARINRALAKDLRMLRKTREDSRWHGDLGDYSVIELSRNQVADTHVDLEAFGRELGVLKDFEVLAKGDGGR